MANLKANTSSIPPTRRRGKTAAPAFAELAEAREAFALSKPSTKRGENVMPDGSLLKACENTGSTGPALIEGLATGLDRGEAALRHGKAPRSRRRPPKTNPPVSLLGLVDGVVDALAPLCRREESQLSDLDKINALKPVIGHFTISDAVLLIGALDGASQWLVYGGKRATASDYAGLAKRLLHRFICSGAAAGPACTSARTCYFFMQKSHPWNNEDRKMFAISLSYDVNALRWGKENYWCGSLFGGRTIDPDEAFEPESWWDRRERLLRHCRDCFA